MLLCLLCFAFVFISKVYWSHESMRHFLPSIVYCLLWSSPFSERPHSINLAMSALHSRHLPSILLLIRRFCVRSLVFPRESQDYSGHSHLLNTGIDRTDELEPGDARSPWEPFRRVQSRRNVFHVCLSLFLSICGKAMSTRTERPTMPVNGWSDHCGRLTSSLTWAERMLTRLSRDDSMYCDVF